MLLLCAGCDGPILDRFLLNVLDRVWHINCVQCSECKCPLADKCFSRDGRLFCRDDFFRRFGTKCGGCGQGILPNDLVRRARQSVYHIKCFLCSVCRKQLSTGEQLYVVNENQFLCKDDYIATKLNSGFSDPLGSDGDTPIDKADETFSDHDDYSPCAAPPPCFNNDESSRDSVALPFPAMTATARNGSYAGAHGPVSSSSGLSPPISDWRSGSKAENCGGSDVIVKSERQNGIDECSFDSASSCCDDTASVRSSGPTNNNNNDEKTTCGKDKSGTGSDGGIADGQTSGGTGGGAKRRGPRTTIKAKQLETLKSAFAATPKPTRHIREQLAQETGLNMRVIQVWFQNRRSKERRMKQLSAMGARRQFFRNPRRLRALRPGEEFGPDALDLLGPGALGYFTDGCEFYTGYPGGGFGDYFPSVHHGVADHPGLAFLSPPTSVPHVSQQHADHLGTSQLHDGMFMPGELVLHSAPLQQALQSSPALQSHQHQQPSVSSSVVGRHLSSPVDRHLVQSSTVPTQQQQQQQSSLNSTMIDGGVHHFASTVAAATLSQNGGPPALSAVSALSGPPQTVMSANVAGLFGHHPEMMETW